MSERCRICGWWYCEKWCPRRMRLLALALLLTACSGPQADYWVDFDTLEVGDSVYHRVMFMCDWDGGSDSIPPCVHAGDTTVWALDSVTDKGQWLTNRFPPVVDTLRSEGR